MRKCRFIVLPILAFFVFAASPLWADISPVGEKVGFCLGDNDVYKVHSGGIDIGYCLIGSGHPLLMLTGLGCTMDDWPEEVVEKLSARYQLVLMDNRGMGFSSEDGTDFSYPLFARDVLALMDELGLSKTYVLGYSQSSVTTQQLLLSAPERFEKAVIHATSVDGSSVADSLSKKFEEISESLSPVVKRQLEAAKTWKSPLDGLSHLSMPVMFLVGTDDTVVGADSSLKLASVMPGSWLVRFKGGSHRLMYEAPKDFASVVTQFLELNEIVDLPE